MKFFASATNRFATGVAVLLIAACSSTPVTVNSPQSPTPAPLPADCARPITYVALGDSTVSGAGASSPEANYVSRLGASLHAAYPRAQVVNLGMNGATAADVLTEQVNQAVGLRPDLVTLSVGPNDIIDGRGIKSFEANVARIFETLGRRSRALLITNLIPDLAVAPRFTELEKIVVGQETIAFNAALKQSADRHGVRVVDLYEPSRHQLPNHPELISGDGYHPSDEGYARWARLMWPAIASAIPAPCRTATTP